MGDLIFFFDNAGTSSKVGFAHLPVGLWDAGEPSAVFSTATRTCGPDLGFWLLFFFFFVQCTLPARVNDMCRGVRTSPLSLSHPMWPLSIFLLCFRCTGLCQGALMSSSWSTLDARVNYLCGGVRTSPLSRSLHMWLLMILLLCLRCVVCARGRSWRCRGFSQAFLATDWVLNVGCLLRVNFSCMVMLKDNLTPIFLFC